jgi:hypothetical protein
MLDTQNGHSPLRAIWQRCRSLAGLQSPLGDCGKEDIERIASDLGISATELRQLASRGPDSTELLRQRMDALDLDRNEILRTQPAAFRDLQRVCTLCSRYRRCSRDLAYDPLDPEWKTYCSNAQTLTALGAMPSLVRQEW